MTVLCTIPLTSVSRKLCGSYCYYCLTSFLVVRRSSNLLAALLVNLSGLFVTALLLPPTTDTLEEVTFGEEGPQLERSPSEFS